ncbi:choice-of-anchor A family protein [Microbacterium sp. CFH 90308]|uniref:Choice-of-anchor A family protein n=1 Tax=Microbacterium salsuginis TaxID=2722803 RepID=A0ABX1KH00_9MICO|nr:DUF5979 domain-containing protein [Microbacterium sp. CFH 90308]NLP84666.1 choice-of-anchor A family protein [Microbacterium sp. CFH 90308]
MSRNRRLSLRRAVASAVAVLMAATGAIALDATLATPAHAAYPDTFNPFSMNGGFTVYAREDALLLNQETEGSIAVGGTATVQGSSGTYSIIHVAAGTGDYTLPTVDGDPTRFLVGSYDEASTGILAITSAGTTEPSLHGDLKMVERDGPWQPFARADWLRLNTDPANPDQTPLIDATSQQYPADASPPAGAVGGGSIYTSDTSGTAVADYVEANAEASYAAAADCLAGLPTGAGHPVGVAEDAGSRVVLEPLSPDQPNIVDYADIAGTALIQYSPGPTPGLANPLIIQVAAGTTEVTGARSDPAGRYSPYILWDLSAVTGPVSVTAAEGGRIDGSIYAPTADVTVTAAPLEGQVLGQNVTIAGGEVHSYLFAGQLSCTADSGSFAVRKSLDGIEPAELPAGTTFTLNYTATEPDNTVVTGTLELPADGSPVAAGAQFPLGTSIEFEEIAPESVPGFEWGTPTISPNPLIVGAGTAEIVVSNTATPVVESGTFSVSKTIEDVSGGAGGDPSQATVPVTWTAVYDGVDIGAGTLDVPFDGTPVAVGQDFPVGTEISLTEDLSGIDPPAGYEWSGVAWSPGQTFTIDENGAVVAVGLTNAISPVDERTITIVKSAEGEASDPAYGYTVTYNVDPPGTRSEPVDLPVGDHVTILDLETGSETLDLAEQVPTLNGEPTDASAWAEPVFIVDVDGVTTEYPSGGFDQIVEIPLGTEGDVVIEVANSLNEGTFALSKAFEGEAGENLPPGTEFSVEWTATTPLGGVSSGVVRLPADGTPVSPLDENGEPLTFPYGTVVTFTELEPPRLRHVAWGDATFDPAQLVIGAGGEPTVSSTLTNSAVVTTGTFQVAKDLVGIEASQLLVDSFTIEYTALVPGQGLLTGSFEIPADGTPAGPVDEAGDPLEFPVGTIVRLDEAAPDASALPPGNEWAGTTWNPGHFLIVGADETPLVEVTNTVEHLTRWAVTKVVDGDAASGLPAGTTFPLEWWWDHVAQPDVALEPGVPVYSPYFAVGSIIQGREGALPKIPGIEWGDPVWTVNGETLVPDADGIVTLPMELVRDQDLAELTLTNTGDARDLPATGGGGMSPLLPAGAIAVILAGLGIVLARRRVRIS